MKKFTQNNIVIYQTKSGAIELKGDFSHETIWATQSEMAKIFSVNTQAITKHIKNIYNESELSRNSTCSKMEQVQIEGKRKIKRQVDVYNLDLLIAVGYRISSVTGTKFRQWATKILHEHITSGFTINKTRISKNYETFLKVVDEVKSLLPNSTVIDTGGVLELVKMFASTWLSLDAYDKSDLPIVGFTKKQVKFSINELTDALSKLKSEMNSNIFGVERNSGGIEGIVGNIFQSFAGQDVYPSIEEKSAHLLYFIVKDHPFMDGNKRSGAFAFVWFLKKAGILNTSKMTPDALTALTLLVAESDPKNKDRIIGLILQLLRK